MPRKKNPPKPVPPLSTSALEQAWSSRRPPQGVLSEPPPTVSGRWLLTAASVTLAAAAACAWLTLCILYWQGSWQLLYHPASAVARTPASVGLAFDPVAFAATEDGEPLLKGWWIPAAPGAPHDQYTVLYLHGQTGNLGDTVDDLAALHAVGVNILAFDYRGYGQSLFSHPDPPRARRRDCGGRLGPGRQSRAGDRRSPSPASRRGASIAAGRAGRRHLSRPALAAGSGSPAGSRPLRYGPGGRGPAHSLVVV
jgi:hypothetical protein